MEETATPVHEHRSRLLEGMARAVAVKGYGDATIADIVREAGVSRRTFYEHFASKPQCLVALYEASSHNALKLLQGALAPSQPWQAQVEQALGAYLGCMADNPLLMRTLFIEILHLGFDGLAARRRVNEELAGFILGVVNAGMQGAGGRAPLSRGMAMAIVGGINELILEYIERDKVGQLRELVAPASQLVRAVTQAA